MRITEVVLTCFFMFCFTTLLYAPYITPPEKPISCETGNITKTKITALTILDSLDVNTTYKRDGNNCVNITEETIRQAQKKGLNLNPVIGCDGTKCHEWIKLDYEPISNRIVDYTERYPNQRLKLNTTR